MRSLIRSASKPLETLVEGKLKFSRRAIATAFSVTILFTITSVGLKADPLIQYTFDEATGTTAANLGSLGSSANLTLNFASNHIAWSSAGNTITNSGSALSMDGVTVTGGVAKGDGSTLNTANAGSTLSAFTITVWVNLSTITTGDRLVSFAGTNQGFDFSLGSITGQTANLGLVVNGVSNSGTSPYVDVVGQWTFLAVTYDGTATSNNVAFYTGETSVAATMLGALRTLNGNTVAAVSTNTTTAVRVGSTNTTALDRTPAGLFDDVRIYGTVLTAGEIEAVRVSAIPEPANIALLAGGAMGLLIMSRRRTKN